MGIVAVLICDTDIGSSRPETLHNPTASELPTAAVLGCHSCRTIQSTTSRPSAVQKMKRITAMMPRASCLVAPALTDQASVPGWAPEDRVWAIHFQLAPCIRGVYSAGHALPCGISLLQPPSSGAAYVLTTRGQKHLEFYCANGRGGGDPLYGECGREETAPRHGSTNSRPFLIDRGFRVLTMRRTGCGMCRGLAYLQ